MRLTKPSLEKKCPNCNSKNIRIEKRVEKESILREAVYKILSQVEPSTRDTNLCVDCDTWFITTKENKPASGGNNESDVEIIDSRSTPGDRDPEHSQKS